jgi:prepilin-type N-terminal cleavage/methylation domain-containing protein
MRFKKGFTLIELLVVISIIAVLITIALVDLSASRREAKIAALNVQLNQIQNKLYLYSVTYGGFPTSGDTDAFYCIGQSPCRLPDNTVVTDHISSIAPGYFEQFGTLKMPILYRCTQNQNPCPAEWAYLAASPYEDGQGQWFTQTLGQLDLVPMP